MPKGCLISALCFPYLDFDGIATHWTVRLVVLESGRKGCGFYNDLRREKVWCDWEGEVMFAWLNQLASCGKGKEGIYCSHSVGD